ncbi:MAG: YeeE/YedE family protein [Candidatus Rokubacteria bacterium]|nr:YeeE/YedE family protein [Candidatus Rokubacteria bacterium]
MHPATSLLFGCLLGFVLQRGDFCLHGAMREVCEARPGPRLRAWALAVGLLAALASLATLTGVAVPPTPPMAIRAVFAGGLLFGVGMVLARACALSMWARVGTGSAGCAAAIAAFAVTVIGASRSPWIAALAAGDDAALAVPARSGTSLAVIVVVAVTLVVLLFVASPLTPEPRRWPWPLTGVAITALVAAGAALRGSAAEGVSALQGVRGLADTAMSTGEPIGSMGVILVGIPIGSWLSARSGGPLAWRVPTPLELARRTVGGALMGIGAVLAAGCNAAHALGGVAFLSPVALVALAGMLAGSAVALRLAGARRGVELRRVRTSVTRVRR